MLSYCCYSNWLRKIYDIIGHWQKEAGRILEKESVTAACALGGSAGGGHAYASRANANFKVLRRQTENRVTKQATLNGLDLAGKIRLVIQREQ